MNLQETTTQQQQLSPQLFLSKLQDKNLFVFDYDGTLTPIVPMPMDAIVTNEQVELINKLAHKPNTKVAILTGRALKDLKILLQNRQDENILLYGTHGAECGSENTSTKYKKVFAEIREKLQQSIDAEFLEYEEKALTICIHYKLAPQQEETLARLREFSKAYLEQFRIQEGHRVFEFMPKDINKGTAIDDLKEKYPEYLPVFLGDDLTDNFAFLATNKHDGLSIQVNKRFKADAKYAIEDVPDTYELIKAYLDQ